MGVGDNELTLSTLGRYMNTIYIIYIPPFRKKVNVFLSCYSMLRICVFRKADTYISPPPSAYILTNLIVVWQTR